MRVKTAAVSVMVLVLLLMGSAISVEDVQARQTESVLFDILERGVVRVGVPTTAAPWGFFNDDYELVGFDVEIAKRLGEELGVRVELVETLNQNRVPYLVSGRVDAIIAVFANTLERAKSVAFSKPYAPFFLMLAGPQSIPIDSLADTAGYRIGLGRGTTCDLYVSERAPEGAEILRYESPTDVFTAMAQGKVDVGCEGYDLMAYQIENFHPDWDFKGGPIVRTFPAIGLPHGDHIWQDWINLFIDHLLNEGFIQDLYEEWFEIPWPEDGIWPSH